MCPCPTPVDPAFEALEEDRAVPIPQSSNTRRKSSTWKTFNLKRQLSKVDTKLKTTLKEKRHSVFYSGQEDCLEDDTSSPESDDDTVIDNKSVIDLSVSPENAKSMIKTKEYEGREEFSADLEFSPDLDSDSLFLVGSMGNEVRKVGFTSRPDNLELMDDAAYPVRPPRHVKKKNAEKRDQRLLSVPNIKFHKADIPSFKDLRDKKEDSVISPQSSFAGNLMRRFSKF